MRTIVITVHTKPIHIFITGIKSFEWDRLWTNYIRAPDPGHILSAHFCKNIMHMPPGLHVLARLISIDTLTPWKPPTIHLPVKAQEERIPPLLGLRRPLAYVFIMLTLYDRGQSKFRLVEQLWSRKIKGSPIDERNIASLPNSIILRFLQIKHLVTTNVATVPPWLAPVKDRNFLPGVLFKHFDRGGIPRGISDPISVSRDPCTPVNRFRSKKLKVSNKNNRAEK